MAAVAGDQPGDLRVLPAGPGLGAERAIRRRVPCGGAAGASARWVAGRKPAGDARLMRIAVMGAGGLGGYFGARLAQGGAEVTFIARGAHLAAMRETGL